MNVFGVFVIAFCVFEGCGGAKNPPSLCPPVRIRFGRVRYRNRGRMARFVCNTGYMLAGERYSVCVGGQWDNTFPKCVRATCQGAKPPVNGFIYPSHGGAVLHFYCKSNFLLRGSEITYCDGQQWENPLPSCLASNSTSPVSCNFEQEDLCGWNHDLNHDFDWKRLNYATPSGSVGTGPSSDHTQGPGKDGYYMYIESSSRNINDTARLISPVYDKSTENVCFEFYYHMYGATTGDLRIYLKMVNETWNLNPNKAIFVKNGNQGNRWYRGFLVLGIINNDFQIVVEGVRGSSYVSDIAIDDVKLIKNCVPEEEIEDSMTTMEETVSSEPPINVESCEHRCNTKDSQTTSWLITCDCDENCFERNRCCPDYFDYCSSGTSPEDIAEDTTETSTTDVTTTYLPTRSKTTTTKPSTEQSKIVYVKPDDSDVDEIPQMNSNEMETPAAPIKEVEATREWESDKNVNHDKIVISPKTVESNTRTAIFAVGVVFGVLFALVGMTFVARKYRLCQCTSLRRMNQSSNGDSQSDVRFLTSDEIIDLTLPVNYETM